MSKSSLVPQKMTPNTSSGPPTAGRQARAGSTPDIDAANQRALTREDLDRLHLRGLLLVGAATAPGGAADSEYFGSLRNRVRKAASTGLRE
jgi:hypothetical protein